MITCDIHIDGEKVDSLFRFTEIPHKGEYIYLEGLGEFKVIKVRRYFRKSNGLYEWYPEEMVPDIYLSSKK